MTSLSHLVARSVVVNGPIDPIGLSGEDGWLLAGRDCVIAAVGLAATIDLPLGLQGAAEAEVSRNLSSIVHFDTAGIGPAGLRAFGALPFSPTAPTQLTVPALIVQRRGDGTWVATSIASHDTMPLVSTDDGELAEETESPKVRSAVAMPTPSGYEEAVQAATKQMELGELQKVVLGRRLTVSLDRPLAVTPAIRRLAAREPLCTVYAVPTSRGRFFGASPELIVTKQGTTFHSRPLAGSVAIDGSDADAAREQAFEASVKNQHEHELVVIDMLDRLRSVSTSVEADPQPSLVILRSIAHLGTEISGTTAPWPTGPDALELAAAIAPTPAVGGVPFDLAVSAIAELEGFDRGEWAGLVGSVDAAGDGTFVLGIRGATTKGSTLVLHAGCGIVAESDPSEELEETTFKLRAVLDVLLPGAADQLFAALSGRTTDQSHGA